MGRRKQCSGDTSETSDEFKIAQEETVKDVKPKSDPKVIKSPFLQSFIKNNIYTIILLLSTIIISILYISFDNCNDCLERMLSQLKNENSPDHLKKYWIYGEEAQKGHLEHFRLAIKRFGYFENKLEKNWDLLWAQDDPFNDTNMDLKNLKSFQRINHFPGYKELYDKVSMARSKIRGIPETFKLPEEANELEEYAKQNFAKTFIYKYPNDSFNLVKAKNLRANLKNNAIVQRLIDDPLLYSGNKFDIGVFVVITSIDPLRIYIYNADIGLRTTANKYDINDPTIEDSYITSEGSVANDLHELNFGYIRLQGTAKQSFIADINELVFDTGELWNEMETIIRNYIMSKEKYLIEETKGYKSSDNFFEMMRFNFMITTSYNVYLMSINPFPNLNSNLFQWDIELYDHVVYNFFGLVGIAPKVDSPSLDLSEEMTRIQSHQVNLGVYPQECLDSTCNFCGNFDFCKLCKKCLTQEDKHILLRSHSEFINKGDCKRIFPPETDHLILVLPSKFETYSHKNRLMHLWFQGKCMLNPMWCK